MDQFCLNLSKDSNSLKCYSIWYPFRQVWKKWTLNCIIFINFLYYPSFGLVFHSISFVRYMVLKMLYLRNKQIDSYVSMMYYNRSLFLPHKKKHALINQNYDIKSHIIMANKMKL